MDRRSATSGLERRIGALAGRQYGVVSRQQLAKLGLTLDAIDGRVKAGRLVVIHPGVYAPGHSVIPLRGRWLAAVLTCGDGAVLSHRCAGALHGVLRHMGIPHVTVPTIAGRRRRPGLRVHRTRWLPDDETTVIDRIPATSLARTFLDLAATEPEHVVKRAVEESERLRIFDLSHFSVAIERHPKRRGTRRLRKVLEHWHEPVVTRSQLERAFLRLCADQSLPKPAVNVWLDPYEVDFLWRRERVIAEVDGRETHLTATAFEADRARDAALTARGYRVVRFTYRQVVHSSAPVGDVLRRLLAG